jgi:2-amino-4-hydroxy-6-hydroxymethyldihydropteridine diphosphokinase
MSTAGTVWTPAYIAVGSNLDEPAQQVAAAFDKLATLDRSRLVLRSKLYRSAPLGPQNQPDFVNAAAGMLTQLPAHELLAQLKQLEAAQGRAQPIERWGPRRIDLDILVYGGERISERGLTVPHAGIAERAFVLVPLRDIAPDLNVPGHGRVRDLAARVATAGLVSLD